MCQMQHIRVWNRCSRVKMSPWPIAGSLDKLSPPLLKGTPLLTSSPTKCFCTRILLRALRVSVEQQLPWKNNQNTCIAPSHTRYLFKINVLLQIGVCCSSWRWVYYRFRIQQAIAFSARNVLHPDLVLIHIVWVFPWPSFAISIIVLMVCAGVLLITKYFLESGLVHVSSACFSEVCSYGFVEQDFTKEGWRAEAYKIYFEISKEHPE